MEKWRKSLFLLIFQSRFRVWKRDFYFCLVIRSWASGRCLQGKGGLDFYLRLGIFPKRGFCFLKSDEFDLSCGNTRKPAEWILAMGRK